MLTFYIISAIVGGVLVLASALAGGDHDAHGDLHVGGVHEAHVEHDAGGPHADVWLPFFSLRFWTYLLTFFGVTGLLLAYFTNLPEMSVAIASGLTGLAAGLAVSFALYAMRRGESTSVTTEDDLVGAEGNVLVSVSKGKPGKVRCNIKGDLIDMTAFTDDDLPLEVGSRALVVSIENQMARVVSLSAMLEN